MSSFELVLRIKKTEKDADRDAWRQERRKGGRERGREGKGGRAWTTARDSVYVHKHMCVCINIYTYTHFDTLSLSRRGKDSRRQ